MTGTITKILRNAGFVTTDDGEEIFFRQPLNKDDKVSFDKSTDDQGRPIAINVRKEEEDVKRGLKEN